MAPNDAITDNVSDMDDLFPGMPEEAVGELLITYFSGALSDYALWEHIDNYVRHDPEGMKAAADMFQS